MINIHNITKNINGESLIVSSSFSINYNEKIALTGPNGSGKSTLLKIIAQIDFPDSGDISINSGYTVGIMNQIPDINLNMSTYDILKKAFTEIELISNKLRELESQMSIPNAKNNIDLLLNTYGKLLERFESIGGYQVDSTIQFVTNGLGINHLLDISFDSLSGGERTKVELAKQLITKPDILLLDEPTNHLDIYSIEWLELFIKNYKGTVLFVSHDKTFLENVAQKVLDIENKKVTLWPYNYKNFLKEKEKFLLAEFERFKNQQKKIKKMKAAIKQLREWANQSIPPSEALHRRASSMEKALDRIVLIPKPQLEKNSIRSSFQESQYISQDIVSIENGSKYIGNNVLIDNINILIRNGEKVGIVGRNGVGKSTLIKCILGKEMLDLGVLRIGDNLKIGYIAQSLVNTPKKTTVLNAFREEINVDESQARNILAKYLFYGSDVYKLVNNLSGGERMRLRLAQLMQQPLNILILDEPTNHLDIETQELLEKCIENFSGTILCVSHNRSLLNKFETILWIKNKQIYSLIGPYNYAREKILEIEKSNS
ncbi:MULTISPECIES: ribosomal protection-like ABC-F family protein [Bacillota]|uniref:ribosomal protection-like ABC-F family protein n=1 Tax=Bacillota TaxID=1239 RepID=UPI0012B7B50E|nr:MULTISPECIES: ABC-F family ATP-binding cassette domain-containing protein [Bacillota]MTH08272.1 ATP-binding cassette domain-containing protein [Turicibacter sanguinis]MCU7192792.1 ATP-binding cassette domain-containing protein [Turicibacter sp. T129]MCU7206769.1 ATP-binding cassette domain-containing protein [Turicibacter sp. GALT-G1]MTH11096.1 ATP-binding cassette domain-containing protein [Turicibacter sanguinis]MTH13863.1 ATP-binding cassette domain-containing protein [Turicibacter sangu